MLLHGLVVLYAPRQYSFTPQDSSDLQAIRIEIMTVPAVPQPHIQTDSAEKSPQPAPEPPPAPAPVQPSPPVPKAATQKAAQPRPEPTPVQESQTAPSETPSDTVVTSLPETAADDNRLLESFAQSPKADRSSLPQTPASLPTAAVPQRNTARIDALRQEYLQSLPPLIRPHQRYPLAAQRAGREGTVIVRFVLERDGRLRETTIMQSSGDALLDQAAASAIERVRRFPAFPAELPEESLPIELPVRFDRSLR